MKKLLFAVFSLALISGIALTSSTPEVAAVTPEIAVVSASECSVVMNDGSIVPHTLPADVQLACALNGGESRECVDAYSGWFAGIAGAIEVSGPPHPCIYCGCTRYNRNKRKCDAWGCIGTC